MIVCNCLVGLSLSVCLRGCKYHRRIAVDCPVETQRSQIIMSPDYNERVSTGLSSAIRFLLGALNQGRILLRIQSVSVVSVGFFLL